jgi:uncharacterized membrane protein
LFNIKICINNKLNKLFKENVSIFKKRENMTSFTSSASMTSSSFISLSNTSSSSTNSDAMDLSTIISLLFSHNVLTAAFEKIRECFNQKKCIACHGVIDDQDKVLYAFKGISFFVHNNCINKTSPTVSQID